MFVTMKADSDLLEFHFQPHDFHFSEIYNKYNVGLLSGWQLKCFDILWKSKMEML